MSEPSESRAEPDAVASDAAPAADAAPAVAAKAAPRRTPLHDEHVTAGGRLVDFAGWTLPIAYGSQLEEHRAVREAAGVFDVSHMTNLEITGPAATRWLRSLLTGDVARLGHGRALYGCLCTETGGVVDDLIVYRLGDERYRVVVNAATRDKDLAWFERHRTGGAELVELEDRVLRAVQGPRAVELAATALEALADGGAVTPTGPGEGQAPDLAALERFGALETGAMFVGRTGYTGEDGLEISVGAATGVALWRALLAAGVVPCGLGARDTLRLEAGMCLYGQDLDEEHTPFESGIGWAVDLSDPERGFVGREALEAQKAKGAPHRRVGLVLEGRGIARAGYPVQVDGAEAGAVTSGGFSPTLGRSIAIARVASDAPIGEIGAGCDVLVRNRPVGARRAKVPFVKAGAAND